MARSSYLGLNLVQRIQNLDFDLHYTWISEERIMRPQLDRSRKQQKQHPDCCLDIVRGWHGSFDSYQFISVVLSDALHTASCALNNMGAQEFSLQVCLQKLKLEPVGSFRTLVGQSEKDFITVTLLLSRFNILKSWLFLVRQGKAALWPEKCSICCLKKRFPWTWQENVPSFFRNVIRDAQQACVAAAQRGGTLASERKIALADIEEF